MAGKKGTEIININRKVITVAEFRNQVDLVSAHNFDRDDFHNIEIAGITLENRDLHSCEFFHAKLSDMKFVGIALQRGNFNFAELNNVVFENCVLENSEFNFCNIVNFRFFNCVLIYSELKFASGNVKFETCSLEMSKFNAAALEAGFACCNLNNAEFNYCSELKLNMNRCILPGGEFKNSKLVGAMEACNLDQCNCTGLDATEVKFHNCNMLELILDGARGFDAFDEEDEF